MKTKTLFRDVFDYGCVWEAPSARCPLELGPCDTGRSALQGNIEARIPENRRAIPSRPTGTSASGTGWQVHSRRLGRDVRNPQHYPLQA